MNDDIVARLRNGIPERMKSGGDGYELDLRTALKTMSEAADIIEAQSKALAEARTVKPLEWDGEAPASTPFGAYTVRDAEGGADGYQWTFHIYPFGVADETVHQSIGKAKTAAEADYQQRILSALVTPTPENPNG